MLLIEQALKKVVEKSILKPGIQFPLQLLALESLKVFRKSVLHFLVSLLWFRMLGREVLVCSVPSVMSMKFMSA